MSGGRAMMGSVSDMLRGCESALIGYQRIPAEEVVTRHSWAPDVYGTYCSRCGSGFSWECHTCSCSSRTLVNRHETLVRLSEYQEPVSDWIRLMKYRSWRSMAGVLGGLLGHAILESGAFEHVERALLVPVPMPWSRRFVRGMDHAGLVCEGVSKTTGFKVFQPLKQMNGPIQSGATMSQRSRKQDPFRVSLSGRLRGRWIKGRQFIVIDDVRTTGRTMGLVTRALEGCGGTVVGAGVLAVANRRTPRRKVGGPGMGPLDSERIAKEMGKTCHPWELSQTRNDVGHLAQGPDNEGGQQSDLEAE